MKYINLLPPGVVKRQKFKRFLIMYTAAAAVIFVMMILLVLCLNNPIRIIKNEIEMYTEIMADEKYKEADSIAGSANVAGYEIEMEPERIDLGVIAFLADAAVYTQTADGFLHLEEISYESNGGVTAACVASDMTVIAEFVHILNGGGLFSDIKIPATVRESGGLYKFKLMMRAGG